MTQEVEHGSLHHTDNSGGYISGQVSLRPTSPSSAQRGGSRRPDLPASADSPTRTKRFWLTRVVLETLELEAVSEADALAQAHGPVTWRRDATEPTIDRIRENV